MYPDWVNNQKIEFPEIIISLDKKVVLPSHPKGTHKFIARKVNAFKAWSKNFCSICFQGEIVPGCDFFGVWKFEQNCGEIIIGINSEAFPREASKFYYEYAIYYA